MGDYEVTYREPTARLGGDGGGTGAPISFGAVMDVRRGDQAFTLHPSRNYYSTADPSRGAISRFFEGEATSEVDVRWGLRRDFWLAVRPDLISLEEPIASADRQFAESPGRVQAFVIRTLAELLPRGPAAGRLPGDRVAAGGVDLDRRRDRRAGRPRGRLAVAGGAAAPRAVASTRRASGRELSRA